MHRRVRLFLVCALVLVLPGFVLPGFAASATAKTPTKAKSGTGKSGSSSVARHPYLGALAADTATGRILFAEGAETRGYPASTLKLMDLLLILERIERGQMSLQDQVKVSARAAKTGGSEVWLAEGEVFTVDELLYALMIQSANDAAVALAEHVAGSTEAFVTLMNQRARELGMVNTVFNSVHGLPPGAGQAHDVTTARDMMLLCFEVLRHPAALRYTGTHDRAFRTNSPHVVQMRNHNHLLQSLAGCDGLKTGYIAAAGYSIAVTAQRNSRRVVVYVLGSADRKERDARAAALVEKAFAQLPPLPAPAAPAPAPTTRPAPGSGAGTGSGTTRPASPAPAPTR